MKVLLLDNYDSFTFNLYHYLLIGGAEVEVIRNDVMSATDLTLDAFDAAVLSPGPGKPQGAGQLMEFVAINAGKKPILGVCLGMQAMGLYYGWDLITANTPKHGKSSFVEHKGNGIFNGLPTPMQVGRYHSLIITKPEIPTILQIEAICDNEVMSVCGADNYLWGVQFHPESILTPQGQLLINNWIGIADKISREKG